MRIAAWTGVAALTFAGPAAADTWQAFSRSTHNAFMAEVDGIATEGEITSIRVATVPREGEAGDLSHSVETYQFRCRADQWRTAGVVEFGPDGAETGQYPEEDAEWEPVRPDTMPGYLKEIACDGARAQPPHWPTILAFVEAGRP
ncbi:surface-adhesin E family protein [Brevundimonas sp.]|uniref:surface-adhesin E family protein n=1 Tax=Brevundimonas sp. TaxID=1871086 RepID=UPI002D24D395|nr:surface-adhesin E family protein [Brevundimonas sp.]HYC68571.1 surface-adhesin E family protein [Brevundimonas sp.]